METQFLFLDSSYQKTLIKFVLIFLKSGYQFSFTVFPLPSSLKIFQHKMVLN